LAGEIHRKEVQMIKHWGHLSYWILGLAVTLVLPVGCSDDDDDNGVSPPAATQFTLRIENVSNLAGAGEADKAAVPFAPGVWALTEGQSVLFDEGAPDGGEGLEALAEDGSPAGLAAAVASAQGVLDSGVFDTPVGQADAGPIGPGQAYEVTFEAEEGSYLTFATMYVLSNDLFAAPGEMGVRLFDDDGNPVTGDITDGLDLWDAGTEINEEPGNGMYQAPTQPGPDTGPTEGIVQEVQDGYEYPGVDDVVGVLVTSEVIEPGNAMFTVRIDNVSDAKEPYPIAPGAWAVHTGGQPLFTERKPDEGEGLEALAEDGMPTALGASLALKPEVVASGTFSIPEGDTEPGPAGPGKFYSFTFQAEEGQSLSFATMFVPSNDLFYSPGEDGIELFSGGDPLSGDITGMIRLWDAGTEINEEPGNGMYQAPTQSAPDTGPTEGIVQPVSDGYTYEAIDDLLRVTLSVE
jgi:hypothetical protein